MIVLCIIYMLKKEKASAADRRLLLAVIFTFTLHLSSAAGADALPCSSSQIHSGAVPHTARWPRN